ncbi:OmpA family protein [Alcanivorax sp. S6407]|uniref:OmpA family protein n=1 Tax=Alcanivorax sp. S6407 TaxID=2926424 RepID=UPI001FF17E4F|nr:OmpA family protein [Alcanivorax sp. S6407]MCK0153813.1 OmpA family protein [Alcanivorax sp. S6407]
MKKCVLLGMMGLVSATHAMEIGPLRTTDKAWDWSLGAHYYADQSQWHTGTDQGDDLIGDLRHQGPFGIMALAFHDRWEVVTRLGFSEYETNPGSDARSLSSSGDAFGSLSVRGEFLRKDSTLLGPFLQYTRYSGYEVSGSNNTAAIDVSDWEELSAGIIAQHNMKPLSVYYGLYHTDQRVNVEGSFLGERVDLQPKEEEHLGLFVGMIKPITRNLSLTAEYDHVSDWGVSVGLNYKLTPPDPVVITRTEVRTEYVEKPAPTGPAEIDVEVRFEEGSNAVDQDYWDEIRQFAEFLNTYEGSEGFITGHCDCLGGDDYNQKLSEDRADAVKVILVKLFGIEESRLTVVGMGDRQPKYEEHPGVGQPLNRRVELKGRAYGEKE